MKIKIITNLVTIISNIYQNNTITTINEQVSK